MDYTWFYVEANIVSIIIFLMILLRELESVGRQSKQIVFINFIFANITYFLSDICWVLIPVLVSSLLIIFMFVFFPGTMVTDGQK